MTTTMRGPAVDELRRLAARAAATTVPAVPVAPPAWVLDKQAEARALEVEQARTLGAAVWRPVDITAGRALVLDNIRTGEAWRRDTAGRWQPTRPAAPVARQVAGLLAQLDDQVDAIAGLLRQQARPWPGLLDEGVQAAVDAGANRSWVRFGRGKVIERMRDTEQRPHRLVLVVDDVEALAASWYADASVAVDPAWAYYCRLQGARAEAVGAGVTPVGTYGDRATALVELLKTRGEARPGRAWRVEPAEGGPR